MWLGLRPYGPIHELQQRLVQHRGAGALPDTVLLLEHEPVITLGRNARPENVLAEPDKLAARGVTVVSTGRGGDVTYHGPGQLVGYPILDLQPDRCDTRRYVGSLCEVMIRIAGQHGVAAGTVEGMIGVWADAAQPGRWTTERAARRLVKIGAVGVRLSRWISMHGFALNLHTDMRAYDAIIPCGIKSHGVASVASLTARPAAELAAGPIALASAPQLAAGLALEVSPVEDLSAVATDALEQALLGYGGPPLR